MSVNLKSYESLVDGIELDLHFSSSLLYPLCISDYPVTSFVFLLYFFVPFLAFRSSCLQNLIKAHTHHGSNFFLLYSARCLSKISSTYASFITCSLPFLGVECVLGLFLSWTMHPSKITDQMSPCVLEHSEKFLVVPRVESKLKNISTWSLRVQHPESRCRKVWGQRHSNEWGDVKSLLWKRVSRRRGVISAHTLLQGLRRIHSRHYLCLQQ